MHLKEIDINTRNWVDLAQDRDYWRTLVNAAFESPGPVSPVRVPSQRPVAPNIASVTSVVNGKGDNETILGAMHRPPGICLTAEENPRNPQPGDV